MKLAAIYARVSTARQEEEQTIKTQLAAVNELIQKRDFKLIEQYIDEGWSGDILARPALDRLRQDAKSKRWEAVVMYDPDRLARRYSYQELVMDELREAGIEVVFVTVAAPQNSEEKILHGVRGLFAEYERTKITERFRLGKLRKVKEGHLLVSEPLYGYRYIPKQEKQHGFYEINEEEARVVRMMFNWVDRDGLTLRKLVRKLQEVGIKPRKSERGVWSTSTLSTLLRHKAYIGQAHWGSSIAVVPENPRSVERYRKIRKSSRRVKPESEWFTVPVPAIVDKDLFMRVQARLKTNYLLARRNTKNEYLLAGKIYCACGRKRAGEGPQHGKHLYYRCTDRVLSFPFPHTCNEKGVNARVVDQLVWNGIATLMTSPRLMNEQIRRWMSRQQTQADSSGADVQFLEVEIGKLKAQADRYNKAYASGLLTLEQLKDYTVPVRDRIEVYASQLAQAERAKQESLALSVPDEREVQAFAEEASDVLKNQEFQTKRGIVSTVVEKVVANAEKLQVNGFIHVKLCPDHRDSLSTIQRSLGQTNSRGIPFQLEFTLAHQNHVTN